MRYLGVDFGKKRIGLAVSDPAVQMPFPLPPIEASGTLRIDATALVAVAKKEDASEIVIGVPLGESASDNGKMQRVCGMLADEVRKLAVEAHLVDESFTSVEAEAALRQQDVSREKLKRMKDSEAACRILERYFSSLTAESPYQG